MRTITLLFIAAALVAVLVCPAAASAETTTNLTGVITNVWFGKMIKANDTYTFDYLPTLYIGINDYGRYTFITGTANLTPGDYAITQDTRKGTRLIKTMSITKYGNVSPEYAFMTIELTKTELAEPLRIIPAPGTEASASAVTNPASGAGQSPQGTVAAAAAAPAKTTPAPPAPTAKSPLSPLTIITGTFIAGLCSMAACRR